MTTTYLHCIHGMIWRTCSNCREKGEDIVNEELNYQYEEQKRNLIYDYQEPVQGSNGEDTDLAYDNDDTGM